MDTSLTIYRGKELTTAEIRLIKFHEDRAYDKQKREEDKRNDMLSLHRKPIKLDITIDVPEIKKDQNIQVNPKEGAKPVSIETAKKVLNGETAIPAEPRKIPGLKHTGSAVFEPIDEPKFQVTNETVLPTKKIQKRERDISPRSPDREETVTPTPGPQSAQNLFSLHGLLSNNDWSPKSDPITKQYQLENFDYDNNQTLAIKLTIPAESKRFSVNICPPDHRNLCDILFHFNPRPAKKSYALNDKQGTWGKAMKYPLNFPSLGTIQLVIQIRPEGFAVFVDGKAVTLFEHRRRNISVYKTLCLTLPAMDDNELTAEDVTFHQVWWGKRDIVLHPVPEKLLRKVTLGLGSVEDNVFARSVEVRGLPKLPAKELYASLYSWFENHGVDQANVVPGCGIAYVRLLKEESVEGAIRDLDGSEIPVSDTEVCTLQLLRPPAIVGASGAGTFLGTSAGASAGASAHSSGGASATTVGGTDSGASSSVWARRP